MRHFVTPALAVTVLAGGMTKPPSGAVLMAATRRPAGLGAGHAGAPRSAVDVAAVTVAADHHLAVAAGTVEKTGTIDLNKKILEKHDISRPYERPRQPASKIVT
jgi:hypothetical protein